MTGSAHEGALRPVSCSHDNTVPCLVPNPENKTENIHLILHSTNIVNEYLGNKYVYLYHFSQRRDDLPQGGQRFIDVGSFLSEQEME